MNFFKSVRNMPCTNWQWLKNGISQSTRKCSKFNKFNNITCFRNGSTSSFPDTYKEQYLRSINDPEGYWGDVSANTIWFKPWGKVLDNTNPPFTKWFVGGKLNMCYNAVDRHIDDGNGNNNAIIWDSPITHSKQTLTYNQVREQASTLARVLINMNVKKGDRVLIYMSMIPEALVAMLACARIGAIHSVVFGGFSAKELGTRIRHCEPKVTVKSTMTIKHFQ